jgi:dihydrofolate reductase
MKISIIVAVAKNNVIGKDNTLVWDLPNDMKYFKEKTLGHCIISGRKNYESIPTKYRPLPNRTNFVLTRQKEYNAPGAIVCDNLNEAIKKAESMREEECFIIGGGEIYKQALSIADILYVTHIDQAFEGDTYFPEIGKEWILINEEKHLPDSKHACSYSFCIYKKTP